MCQQRMYRSFITFSKEKLYDFLEALAVPEFQALFSKGFRDF